MINPCYTNNTTSCLIQHYAICVFFIWSTIHPPVTGHLKASKLLYICHLIVNPAQAAAVHGCKGVQKLSLLMSACVLGHARVEAQLLVLVQEPTPDPSENEEALILMVKVQRFGCSTIRGSSAGNSCAQAVSKY